MMTTTSDAEDPFGIEDVPLFATETPTDPSEGAFGGIQAILYGTGDGSCPSEVAGNLRLSGNEAFRRGPRGYDDALRFYARAIEVQPSGDAADDAALSQAKALTFTNRALVQLSRGNNGHALADARAALQLSPGLSKAHWHAAKALLALRRPTEALQHTSALLSSSSPCGDAADACKKLHERCTAAAAAAKRAADAAAAREEALRRERARISKYGTEIDESAAAELERRGVRVVAPSVDLAALAAHAGNTLRVAVASACGDAAAQSPRLTLPVVLVFEEFAVTDCVADVDEAATIGDVLHAALAPDAPPPPWDERGHYRDPAGIEVFAVMADGHSLARLRHTTTLTALLSHPRYALPRVPVLHLVALASPYRAVFLSQHGLSA